MLRDRFFYPLAVLVFAGIIALALSPGGQTGVGEVDRWELAGEDLNALQVSPGTEMDYLPDEGGYVVLSAFTAFGQGPGSIGIFASLGPAQERSFAGETVEITLRARAARTDPLDVFESAYFPLEGAASAWQRFTLTPDWQDFTYRFTPPVVAAEPNADLVSIWPGKEGERKGMELASVSVAKVSP